MKNLIAATILAIGVGFGATSADAAAIRVGTLKCTVDSGWGAVIGSSKKADCVFTGTNGKRKHYDAKITKIGIDVGYTANKTIAWVVLSAEGNKGGLAGTYMGVNAEATAIVGLGANALVGGLNNNFALQPISVQGQTGLNVAAGVATLTLN